MGDEIVGLSKALKDGINSSHSGALERGEFMTSVIKKTVKEDVFALFECCLYHMYVAMEEAINKTAKDQPGLIDTLLFPELVRHERLRKDLEFYYGDEWENKSIEALELIPGIGEYVERLQHIGETPEDQYLIIAHIYVRYMGDLSGGQLIGKKVREALNLAEDENGEHPGCLFYEFPGIPDPVEFKKKYRGLLDALEVTPEQVEAVISEANDNFARNDKFFVGVVEVQPPSTKNITNTNIVETSEVEEINEDTDDVGDADKLEQNDFNKRNSTPMLENGEKGSSGGCCVIA